MSDPGLIAIRKAECELDGLYFARYFFKERFGIKMIINWHHIVIQSILQEVIDLKRNRVIINIPPGYTKTELIIINFIARGLALNPMSRFLHLSYSKTLALENSSTIRKIIKSPKYQEMWPVKTMDDADAKEKWWTEQSGGMYSTSARGQVTGFRAGHMQKDKFSGALLMDDMIKPDDVDYEERIKINNRMNNTIESRLAVPEVPIILIGQRVHKNDLSGYLLTGGTGETWDHYSLPVLNEEPYEYPEEYTHGKQIKCDIPKGWLWPFKHDKKHLISLMSHKFTWLSQYQQRPEKIQIENALFTEENIKQYKLSKIPYTVRIINSGIGIDPSGDDGKEKVKEKDKADMIGEVVAMKGDDGHYYVTLDCSLNGGPAEWAQKAVDVYHKRDLKIMVGENNYGGAMVERCIRTVKGGESVKYKKVTASRGKLVRAEPISALYEQGLVHHVGFFPKLEEELTTYNGKGKSPNRLDALVWILSELSGCNQKPVKAGGLKAW